MRDILTLQLLEDRLATNPEAVADDVMQVVTAAGYHSEPLPPREKHLARNLAATQRALLECYPVPVPYTFSIELLVTGALQQAKKIGGYALRGEGCPPLVPRFEFGDGPTNLAYIAAFSHEVTAAEHEYAVVHPKLARLAEKMTIRSPEIKHVHNYAAHQIETDVSLWRTTVFRGLVAIDLAALHLPPLSEQAIDDGIAALLGQAPGGEDE